PGPPRRLSSATIEKGVHSETGWSATAARGRGTGGQGCSTGRGHHPQSDLRGRFSGLLIWLPARAQPAPSAGCAVRRDHAEEGELDFGLRYQGLFRQFIARLAPEVRPTSRCRPPHSPADPEMAEGWSAGGR